MSLKNLLMDHRILEKLVMRQAAKSPKHFRNALRISSDDTIKFRNKCQHWQKKDFESLDPAWKKLAGHSVTVNCQRAYIERPRGHSKTSDMAIQLAWIIQFSPDQLSGLVAAADREQASLIWEAIRKIATLNPRLCSKLSFRKHLVINTETGTQLDIISSDVSSSWGALPDFVVCDELCHWEKPDMWYSLLSSAAKRPNSVLVVLTNAGFGRGWHWDVREAARENEQWYFSSLDGSQAPWIHPVWLEEQKDLLPTQVYERLWLNRWQHSDGTFITLEEAESCRDSSLKPANSGQPGQQYIAAIDYAEKRDYTVGVLLHHDGSRIVVDRCDVVVPSEGNPVKVSWVENWIKNIKEQFHQVHFIIDEYQLLSTIQKLENNYSIERFEFRGGKGNHSLAICLRKLIIHQEITWYPGCGQLPEIDERDDLETELSSLLLKQKPNGRCRIDHLQDGRHHDDRCFALGAAALHLETKASGQEWMQVNPSTVMENWTW
jgi:phage terminase large subunit-like protein